MQVGAAVLDACGYTANTERGHVDRRAQILHGHYQTTDTQRFVRHGQVEEFLIAPGDTRRKAEFTRRQREEFTCHQQFREILFDFTAR